MSFTISNPGQAHTTVSPAVGSTGFSSAGVAFADSSGALTNSSQLTWNNPGGSSAWLWIQSTKNVELTTRGGALLIAAPGGPGLQLANNNVNAISSAGAAAGLNINAFGGNTVFGGNVSIGGGGCTVGSSASASKLSLPSTLNTSTSVGGSGAAASVAVTTPEVFIKILAPNAAGTLTTLYIAAYLSTG